MPEAAMAVFDDEVRAYIAKVDSHYPADAVDLDIAGQRRVYDDLCKAFSPPYPASVTAADGALAGPAGAIAVRTYLYAGSAGAATVVYYHGGGFVVGGLHSHDSVCAEIAAATGFEVVAVDYRLAPEHVHPAHFDDALAAFEVIAQSGRPVVVAGDSAGGNLAAAVALACRGRDDAPVGQLLIYPGLGGEQLDLPSYVENAHAVHLATADVHYYWRQRAGGDPPLADPTFAPLAATDLAGVCPCLAISADIDPLRDDAEAWCQRLRQHGVAAVAINEPGLVHGYLRARHMSRRAAASFQRITDGISRLGRGLPLF